MSLVGAYLTADYVPFVITDTSFVVFRCSIPVLPGGDGAEDAPLEERTERCPHTTTLFVGRAATCPHHLAMAIRIGGVVGVRALTATCESGLSA